VLGISLQDAIFPYSTQIRLFLESFEHEPDMKRKKIAAGNWKMNKTMEEGKILASEAIHMVRDEVPTDVDVVFIPPFPYLTTLKSLVGSAKNIHIGAQNCSDKVSGALTGEVSAPMLKSCGVDYVLVGHSERREFFGESDETLALKTIQVLAHGMMPIFCCGEPLKIREANGHIDFVRTQLDNSLKELAVQQMFNVVIAYEPIWAIGTGVTASSAQAQEMHAAIRGMISDLFGNSLADILPILYGGSVNAGNARELFAQPDVDGGLVGGASLKSREFADIAKSFS
jgi:triosephosphate isomerase (TIM)